MITNSDSRMRNVLASLGVAPLLDPIIISEEVGVPKPKIGIFQIARREADACKEGELLHIGDEQDEWVHFVAHVSSGLALTCVIISDYFGALNAGSDSLLLRRPGPDGISFPDGVDVVPPSSVVHSLQDVVPYILEDNKGNDGQ